MDKAIIEQNWGTQQNIAPNHGDMERFAAAVIKDSQDSMWSSPARELLVRDGQYGLRCP